jgi:hypothetical protein
MKLDASVRALLSFRFRNLKGCKVGIIDGKGLLITPLRWGLVP